VPYAKQGKRSSSKAHEYTVSNIRSYAIDSERKGQTTGAYSRNLAEDVEKIDTKVSDRKGAADKRDILQQKISTSEERVDSLQQDTSINPLNFL
jgi:hypothetical protein